MSEKAGKRHRSAGSANRWAGRRPLDVFSYNTTVQSRDALVSTAWVFDMAKLCVLDVNVAISPTVFLMTSTSRNSCQAVLDLLPSSRAAVLEVDRTPKS